MSRPSPLGLLLNRRMLLCVLTGFSSGLPLYVLIQLVPAWLRTEGVSLEAIGLFGLVQLPYTWKFVWAPLMDRFAPRGFGRRRGWALFTQLGLMVGLAGFGALEPARSVSHIAVLATLVALFSASQDIVLDAYRREILSDAELGLGNAWFVNGYRASALIPGGFALVLADHFSFSTVHTVVAAFMAIGIVTTLLCPEPAVDAPPPRSLKEAVIEPFREFFGRSDLRQALLLLGFLFCYKIGDSMATTLSTPFYLDTGFSKSEIGTVAKVVGLSSTLIGGTLGGLLMMRIGINRALWSFGVVQMVSILGFAALAEIGPSVAALGVVVAFEYLGVGLGTSAFTAFIARATSKRFSATQFALFSSLFALSRTVAGATTGFIIEAMGYTRFFLLCTLIALPGMLLLFRVAPWNADSTPEG